MVGRLLPLSSSATRCLQPTVWPSAYITPCMDFPIRRGSRFVLHGQDKTGPHGVVTVREVGPGGGFSCIGEDGMGWDGAREMGLLEGVWHAWHCCAGG